MTTDYLVIGLGLSGSFLCRELEKAGQSFLVIDDARPDAASRIASGIINPVTGRRIVKTWMIDELLPYAEEAYTAIEKELAIRCFQKSSIIDFFPTPQMKLAFNKRITKDADYLLLPQDENDWREYIQYDFGYGIIDPCFLVDVNTLLNRIRLLFLEKHILLEERFEIEALSVTNERISYKGIEAKRIIFCDGIHSMNHPFFKNLPFAPNKGEVLIIDAPGLPSTHILKKGISVIPWEDNLFWVGSSHEWDFPDDQPTAAFREKTISQLNHYLRMPYKVIEHLAAVRPATLERRPFAGIHPSYPSIGIFNGMGTKGCSLAPYFARQFVAQLTGNSSLSPEVDISRFRNVLNRK